MQFIKSAPSLDIAPEGDRPEFAFIGRSNVGKSSLINRLAAGKLAQTSGTPGKTRLLNYYMVQDRHWVDLPGYGYAKVGKEKREEFMEIISEYLEGRKALLMIFVLIDLRHPPQKNDIEFLLYLDSRSLAHTVLFTKSDKLATTKVEPAVTEYLNLLLNHLPGLPPAFATSSETGYGRDRVLAYMEELVRQNAQ
jgi:GTP-binding protein